ncbi:MAG: prepilin-type N-terminal cleavage/methylation domain-containing protein [Marmoricola sp.]
MQEARRHSESGESLIELLVAIVILGLTGVAVMAGLGLAAKSSDIGRKESTGGAYVRSFAEAIQQWVDSNGLAACGAGSPYSASTVGFAHDPLNAATLPNGYTATAVVQGSPAAGGLAACSNTGDQQVLLTVASADGRATERLTVVLRRPCTGSLPNPC